MINKSGPGKALIVDDEKSNRLVLETLLVKQGYQVVEAENGQQAVELFEQERPDIVFMDVMMPVMDGYEATRRIKAASGSRFVPVLFLTALNNKSALAECIDAGGDDFLVKPYDSLILQSKIRSMQRITLLHREVQGMYSMIHREQEVAESVFVNAIQRTNINNPCLRQVVRPASIFSGDMVLSAYSPGRDLYFLTGDFTGHGLLAALGAMPVSEVFRSMTAKGFSPEAILSAINRKLKQLLPTGMFFAAQLVVVNHDLDHVRVFNAGMPEILIVDGNSHKIKKRLGSTGLPLGVDASADMRQMLQLATIATNDRILMYSDGLIEADNTEGQQFGLDRLVDAIAAAPADQVFDSILDRLDDFCGQRAHSDDVTLAEIQCSADAFPGIESPIRGLQPAKPVEFRGEWKLALQFDGPALREASPVPPIVSYLLELELLETEQQSLSSVLTELYTNALDYGLLDLDPMRKHDPAESGAYFQLREERLQNLDSGYIAFDISAGNLPGQRFIELRVEDSGTGFDFSGQLASIRQDPALSSRGLAVVNSLCDSLEFEGNGQIAVARFTRAGA